MGIKEVAEAMVRGEVGTHPIGDRASILDRAMSCLAAGAGLVEIGPNEYVVTGDTQLLWLSGIVTMYRYEDPPARQDVAILNRLSNTLGMEGPDEVVERLRTDMRILFSHYTGVETFLPETVVRLEAELEMAYRYMLEEYNVKEVGGVA